MKPEEMEMDEDFIRSLPVRSQMTHAVDLAITRFGRDTFTRNHVVYGAQRMLPDVRADKAHEIVRQMIMRLEKQGRIEKTGQKRFRQDLYRAVK